ncbi:MAG: glycosyltransferase family 4 protein [Armatimonadota bacterium]|jgi:glycosyltransferase involved in cell wall biosynthesis
MAEGRPGRVLLVNHVGAVSGAEESMLTLVRHLNRERFEPVAAVPPGRLATELDELEVPVSLVPELRLSRSNLWSVLAGGVRLRSWAGKVRVAAEELGAEIVAANSLTAALGCAMRMSDDLPLVWHARDLQVPERAVRWVVPRVTRIAAISACVADALIDGHPEARSRTVMIHNGVDTLVFQPDRPGFEVREELGLPADAPVIGSVGQLVPWKRQDLFLEVAAHVLAHEKGAYFLVVGADMFGEHPDYVEELHQIAESLGLSERAVFTGFREDIASVMNVMDVLVHPVANEPLGRVVLEAMSLGVPCVAVGSCGPSEIIDDGETGILVPRADPRRMAARVVELLSRQGGAERMGREARRRINERFTAEQMAQLTEDLYEEALAAARR